MVEAKAQYASLGLASTVPSVRATFVVLLVNIGQPERPNGSKLTLGAERATMNTTCDHPRFFPPHANLSDAVNSNIVQSEIEGGVHLQDLPPGTVLEVQTQNRSYTILYKGWDQALISGHPVFCPQPVPVTIHGSSWGGSMLKTRFIGRGMRLEFGHPEFDPIRTSVIVDVRSR